MESAVAKEEIFSQSSGVGNTNFKSAEEILGVVENSPVNIMLADTNGTIQYMNPKSLETLTSIEQLLPVKANKVVGGSYDIFHSDQKRIRDIVSNEKNLPHRANIRIGEETLDLLVTGLTDQSGNYVGPMLTWEVITKKLATGDFSTI